MRERDVAFWASQTNLGQFFPTRERTGKVNSLISNRSNWSRTHRLMQINSARGQYSAKFIQYSSEYRHNPFDVRFGGGLSGGRLTPPDYQLPVSPRSLQPFVLVRGVVPVPGTGSLPGSRLPERRVVSRNKTKIQARQADWQMTK